MLKKNYVEIHGQTFMFNSGIIWFSNNQLPTNKKNRMDLLIFTNRLTQCITYSNFQSITIHME